MDPAPVDHAKPAPVPHPECPCCAEGLAGVSTLTDAEEVVIREPPAEVPAAAPQ